jgi:hypothetical protein
MSSIVYVSSSTTSVIAEIASTPPAENFFITTHSRVETCREEKRRD